MSHSPRPHISFLGFARDTAADAISSLRSFTWRRWLFLVCLCVLAVAFVVFIAPRLNEVRDYAHRLGPWLPLAFWLAYVVFTLFPTPRTIWTVSAGLLFGPWEGLALSLGALTVSALVTVVGIRALLNEWLAPRLRHPAVATISAHLERRGWVAVGSLRMVAGVPFCLLNYVCALTPIPLRQFTVATFFGSIPTTTLGVFFGDSLTGHAKPWVIATIAVLATVGVVVFMCDLRSAMRARSHASSL